MFGKSAKTEISATQGNNKQAMQVLALMALCALPIAAHAGTGGTEFSPLLTMLTDWLEGALGTSIALTFFLVGIIAGIVKSSLMLGLAGVGAAILLTVGPSVITSMFTALI